MFGSSQGVIWLTIRYAGVINLVLSAAAALWATFALRAVNRSSRIANAPGALWKGRPNISHASFIGYAFGATVAAEAARLDRRISAAVNLNGALFGRAARADVVNGPYFLMLSDTHYRLPIPRHALDFLARRLLSSHLAPQAPTRPDNHEALDFRGACA